jgi:hypothetical protein
MSVSRTSVATLVSSSGCVERRWRRRTLLRNRNELRNRNR